MSTEPRRPGRPSRNGSAPPPAKAEPAAPSKPTATQQLARLQELRNAHGGYVIPPPPGINAARLIDPTDPDQRHAGQQIPNEAMKRATAWLREIAELGSPKDLTLAWEAGWRPRSGLSVLVNPKTHLRALFEHLKNECGARWRVLHDQAERESRIGRVVASLRADYHRAKAAADAIHADYVVACEKAKKIELEIVAVQRRARGESLH
jgi:hypothetical protein